MNLLAATALGMGLYVASGLHQYGLLQKNYSQTQPDYAPPTASIVLPTMNDANIVETTLQSILANTLVQTYPERFELIVIDSGSDDTKKISERYHARYYHVSRGKLLARDTGFQLAKGEIVVGIDSDIYYPPNYLTELLRPFLDNTVVATSGIYKTAFGNPMIEPLMNLADSANYVYYLVKGGIVGGANAIRRSSYFAVGGFDLQKDSLNWLTMHEEEEVAIALRLRTIGQVVRTQALAIHSPRRGLCIANPSDPYCQSIGKERF